MKFPCVTDTYTVPINFYIRKVRKLRPGVTGTCGLLEKSGEEEKSERIKGRIICLKAGVNVKAVFTSLNTAFLPISRSRFKRR